MKQVEVEIDDIKFQIVPMGAMKASILDRKIIAMLAPSAAGLLEDGFETEVRFDKLISNLGNGLLLLSDDQYQSLLLNMFAKVTAIKKGNPVLQLNTVENIDDIFEDVLTIYKLLYEIMRVNGFSLFKLVGGGLGMKGIPTLDTLTTKINSSLSKSEKLES